MLVINNVKGAQEFTTAKIFVLGEEYATLRSLGEIKKSEMNNYLVSIFDDGCFTNHMGESELVLGSRLIDLDNGAVSIEIDVDFIDGGLVNCHMMAEWESSIKKARKIAAILYNED